MDLAEEDIVEFKRVIEDIVIQLILELEAYVRAVKLKSIKRRMQKSRKGRRMLTPKPTNMKRQQGRSMHAYRDCHFNNVSSSTLHVVCHLSFYAFTRRLRQVNA